VGFDQAGEDSPRRFFMKMRMRRRLWGLTVCLLIEIAYSSVRRGGGHTINESTEEVHAKQCTERRPVVTPPNVMLSYTHHCAMWAVQPYLKWASQKKTGGCDQSFRLLSGLFFSHLAMRATSCIEQPSFARPHHAR
jgi:hypothetical protein